MLKVKIKEKGIEEIARMLNITKLQLNEKIMDRDKFTIHEIKNLIYILGISQKEANKYFL